jgi:hypothetical protein
MMGSVGHRTLTWVARAMIVQSVLMTTALGGTFYVDGARPTDAGDGRTQATAKKFIASGISLLSASGGDTLVIRDGTYATADDRITAGKRPSAPTGLRVGP